MLYRAASFVMCGGVGAEEDYRWLHSQRGNHGRAASEGYRRYRPVSRRGALSIWSGEGCGRVRWRVCGGVSVVAMEWPVSGSDPQVFRFICFYT